jgi:NAD(P)-dependent dehydrogenase (short-subunit alcohol dehydrogenase family)
VHGKTVVITGATSGIGEVAALKLAEAGARIVFVARDKQRAASLMARLTPGAHVCYPAELMLLSEQKRVGAEIARAEPVIDVLINNAGAFFSSRKETADGLERTFALNHMAYFVLTQALLENVKAARKGRIVNTASAAHFGATLDFDDLQSARQFDGYRAYRRSKLCNILFTRELALRLSGTGVTANCLHPGFVATRFGSSTDPITHAAVKIGMMAAAVQPEQGAQTLLYLARSHNVEDVSGLYFDRAKPVAPRTEAQDEDAAERLWRISEAIAAR